MKDNILEALNSLRVAELARDEWLAVGMALKEEGYSCSVWDEWSRNDSRYHPGECEKLWGGFKGSSSPVKGGTIVQLAKDRGWTPFFGEELSWDDTIQDDGDIADEWNPVQELTTYINLLFSRDDVIGYVTGDTCQDKDGKWKPLGGVYNRTAGELLDSLKKHPDDIAYTVGDWEKEAGAWIRFNPLDGKGVGTDNVTAFRYALVESDTLPVHQQEAVYRKLEIPAAVMVNSGGKSIHAIVRIDAENEKEYRERVQFLYEYMEKNGITIDKQNRNPSRLSRMPGITRNGRKQRIVAINTGKKSWYDFVDFVEGADDELPEIEALSDYVENPPVLPEELIEGILRRGHKMLISGSSKAGKSFLLMELCIALAEGSNWLGFSCKKGRVLYVNLEIDKASAINRFLKIYETLGIPKNHADDIEIWNLRGHAVPLNELVPKLVRRVKNRSFDAIVIDPIYKVITGDENNASDMGAFCNQFDKICAETGCSAIYCHHHSKGAQGAKKAMDRASGSGVFARDPDAQLDMIQLDLTDDLKNNVAERGATAWRLESSLREFANIIPINFWFEYPVHRVDTSGELGYAFAEGSPESKNSKVSSEVKLAELDSLYDECNIDGRVLVKDMAALKGVTDRTIRNWLSQFKFAYDYENGFVFRKPR